MSSAVLPARTEIRRITGGAEALADGLVLVAASEGGSKTITQFVPLPGFCTMFPAIAEEIANPTKEISRIGIRMRLGVYHEV